MICWRCTHFYVLPFLLSPCDKSAGSIGELMLQLSFKWYDSTNDVAATHSSTLTADSNCLIQRPKAILGLLIGYHICTRQTRVHHLLQERGLMSLSRSCSWFCSWSTPKGKRCWRLTLQRMILSKRKTVNSEAFDTRHCSDLNCCWPILQRSRYSISMVLPDIGQPLAK